MLLADRLQTRLNEGNTLSGAGKTTGGDRSFALPLAKAAAAMGIASFFLEFHPDPANAWCETETQIPLNEAESFLTELKKFDDLAKGVN